MEDRPRLVDDDEAFNPVGAPQAGLQPGGGARHQEPEGGRVVEGGEVEHDDGPVEVDPDRGRPVEHPGEVAFDHYEEVKDSSGHIIAYNAWLLR